MLESPAIYIFTKCGIKSFFTKHYFTALTLVAAWLSFWLLGLALRELPVGTAYAVWTGVGAVGTALMGILFFKEPATFWRMLFLATLIGSIIGLKSVTH